MINLEFKRNLEECNKKNRITKASKVVKFHFMFIDIYDVECSLILIHHLQNHNYAVDPASLPKGVEVTHVNLNDGSCAGLAFPQRKLMSLQYHPEASPGPHDSDSGNEFLFTLLTIYYYVKPEGILGLLKPCQVFVFPIFPSKGTRTLAVSEGIRALDHYATCYFFNIFCLICI